MVVQAQAPRHAGRRDGDRLDAYLAARRRGTDWLLGLMNPDGSIGDPAEGYKYYRAPGRSRRPARSRPATRSAAGSGATC